MNYTEIHIWGDSIARGVTLDETRGRYALSKERCAERLKQACGVPVLNRALMGETAPEGLARFLAAPGERGALCAIEYGGNDCDLDWARVSAFPDETITPKVMLEAFADALRGFGRAARERGMEPVFVTPPPLCAPRYFQRVTRGLDADRVLLALGDVEHIYRWQERYTIAMRWVAAELGCRLLDVRDAFLAQNRVEALMSGDGIHPSDAGHRLIADVALAKARALCGEWAPRYTSA